MLHEAAAGYNLEDSFFRINNIDPDMPVRCNCKWDNGHEPTCQIVEAHALRQRLNK